MLVSFVMPNFNHALYLRASVGGMLSQLRPADEIIIVDDASTDDSIAVLEELTSDHSNVRVIRNAVQGGVVQALRKGFELSTGEFVAFLGADDRVNSNFLSTTAALLETYPSAAFACSRAEVRDGRDRLTGERPIIRPSSDERCFTAAQASRQLVHADNFFLGAVTLYRRSRLVELGGFDEALGPLSDGLLQRRMAVRWGYAFSPRTLGLWRIHGSNYSVTAATDVTKLEQSIALSRAVLASEPAGLFPCGYAKIFERRLRFNGARLLAAQLPQSAEGRNAICRMIAGNATDRKVLAASARLGPLYWFCVMTWLCIKLRPFSLSWLIGEALLRTRGKTRELLSR